MEHIYTDHTRRLQALHRIRRDLGLTLLGTEPPTHWIQRDAVVPCGIPALEWTLGMEGVPRGHIVEVLGAEHAGKSTLALAIAAGAQSGGATVAWIDAAHQLDANYAFSFGVQGEELLISRPRSAEHAMGIITMLVRSDAVDLIILDSVSAMIPQSDLSSSPPSEPSGSTPLVLLRSLRRLYPLIRRSSCCVLFLDQLADRDYSGAGAETSLSTRIVTPFSSVRAMLRRVWKNEVRLPLATHTARLTVSKNRLGPRGRTTEIVWGCRHAGILENAGKRTEPLIFPTTPSMPVSQ